MSQKDNLTIDAVLLFVSHLYKSVLLTMNYRVINH